MSLIMHFVFGFKLVNSDIANENNRFEFLVYILIPTSSYRFLRKCLFVAKVLK